MLEALNTIITKLDDINSTLNGTLEAHVAGSVEVEPGLLPLEVIAL
jgi:hypothetical protein